MSNILPKGTEVRCPRKRHLIGVLNRQINSGGELLMASIDFESGQERVAGETMTCKICGSTYFIQGKLFTENGWSPSDPNLEPVPRR